MPFPQSLRPFVRATTVMVGEALFHVGVAPLVLRFGCRKPIVLVYHACEHQENEFLAGLGINTRPDNFATHIDYLTKHYRVVPLEDLLTAPRGSTAVALTFDDGFASVYHNAMPRLRALGVPFSVHVVTSTIDNERLTWVEELNWLLTRDPDARAQIAATLGLSIDSTTRDVWLTLVRMDPALASAALQVARSRSRIDPVERAREIGLHLGSGHLLEMANAGVRLGNHSVSHRNLVTLDEASRRHEIAGADDALEKLRIKSASLAFPFAQCDERLHELARRLGHALVVCRPTSGQAAHPAAFEMIQVADWSVAELFARVEIGFPLLRALERLNAIVRILTARGGFRRAVRVLNRTVIRAPFGFGEPVAPETWNRACLAESAVWKPAAALFAAHAIRVARESGIEQPRILELGCGAGHVLAGFPAGSFRHYTGVDCSSEAIRIARARSPHSDETTTFVLGDFEHLVLSGRYDVILARESLYYARHPAHVVARFSPGLDDRGIWLISMHDSLRNRWLWTAIQRYLIPLGRTFLYNDAGQRLDVRTLRVRSASYTGIWRHLWPR